MTRVSHDEAPDERLRELLDVEERLQQQVRMARVDAARRVGAERDERARRLADAHASIDRADEAQARRDRLAHEKALAELEVRHRAALEAITGITGARIDELARRAIDRAIAPDGDRT